MLQEVGNTGNRDFWLEKTGAQAWQFRTDNLRGDDRSATVQFSSLFGNMRRAALRSNHRAEKTRALIGGGGNDDTRTYRTRTGANYNATYNSIAVFVNGAQYGADTDGLDTEGDVRLEEVRARETLSFDVIQVPSTLYGKHYFLGDKVNAFFRGYSYTPQIHRVSIDVRSRGNQSPEQIAITMADI